MSLTGIKNRMLEYVKTIEEAEKRIPDLEKRSEAFVDQQRRRREIRGRIDDLAAEIEPKEEELAGLKEPYIDALFQMDVSKQRTLQARKKKLENEIRSLEKAHDAEVDKLEAESVDDVALAELKAELDSFQLPAALSFIRDLQVPLENVVRTLRAAFVVWEPVPSGYDEERYRSVRMELDDTYRSQQKRAEAQLNYADEKQARRGQRIGEVNEREATIAAGLVDDRVSATVSDRPALLDEDDESA